MLSKLLLGPVFGAALASGWWAYFLWDDPSTHNWWSSTLIWVTVTYVILCVLVGLFVDYKWADAIEYQLGPAGPLEIVTP